MLKNLKKKFVLTNVCLVGIVLLIVFTVVCMNSYDRAKGEVENALKMALEDSKEKMPAPFEIGEPPEEEGKQKADGHVAPLDDDFKEKPFDYAVVVISVEKNGEKSIVESHGRNASMNIDVMKGAVDIAIESEDESGKIPEMELFYQLKEDNAETKIAFADSAYFDAEIKKTILTSVTLFFSGMIAVFLISILLANIAVGPVKKAWQQQKRFVADASHELKTPLTVMLANNEIIAAEINKEKKDADEETSFGKSAARWVESNREEVLHMKKLVDDLLFLAKADEEESESYVSKKKKTDMVSADVSEIITDVSLQMEPVGFEAGVRMDIEVAKGVSMKCSITAIKQLTHILVDNAIKYCKKNGTVWIKLKENSHAIELSVTNSGRVIRKEDIDHIFERFYRSDKARSGEGHGLGLSIAKTITENHGGEISVRSGILDDCALQICEKDRAEKTIANENTGTVFTVIFPK